MSSRSSRVQSNLLQQNCFVRDVTRRNDFVQSSSPETFVSIDEVVTKDGVKLVEKEYPYPITPQYVNSFVDSSDYRKDPFSAINNGNNRVNLGDIRDLQDVASMDMEHARSLYSQLVAKFSSKPDDPKPDGPEPDGPKSDGGN